MMGVSVGAQQVRLTSRYEVSGHAAEHLGSASTFFFACALVGTLLLFTRDAWRQPLVVIALGAWLVTTVFVLIGNVQVVDALIADGLADVPTDRLVPTVLMAPLSRGWSAD